MLYSRAFQPEPVSSLHQLFLLTTVGPSSLNQLTTLQLTSSTATAHQQPAHQPKSDNRPSTATSHQQQTNQPANLQQPTHRPKTDKWPSATFTHQQLTSQPATLHQQPSHRPETGQRPSSTNQLCTGQDAQFEPSTAIVEVEQSLDTDVDTSSDTDSESVVNVQPTGQAEGGEASDLDQDISLIDTDQTCTEAQNYRDNAWCTFLLGLDTHTRH